MLDFAAYNRTRAPEDRVSACFAPSINLNFEQNGNVTACCYNRSFVLGTYPRDSLEAIWNGPKIAELRAALKANDLSKGCDICRDQLAARNFDGMRARHFDAESLRRESGKGPGWDSPGAWPRILEFEISNLCNLECTMCNGAFSSAIRKNREKLPPLPKVYDRAFVGEIKPFLARAEWTRFLGGEPFLNPLYFPMWEELIALGPRAHCAITTNGTILNLRVKDTLERLKPHLVVSIDSVDAANYERIRKNASFQELLEHMEYFIDYRDRTRREVHVAVCPTRENWQDLPALLAYCSFNSLKIAFNTVLWPLELSLRTLPPAELRAIHRFLSRAPQGLNKQAWDGLLSQVAAWAAEAESSAAARVGYGLDTQATIH
jgi:MoaA/NifB/PqqE/SkfB family radical SAM enzyme